ncbi:MAG: tetratricopeptide repeat protein [Cytophagaceae bacterium]
MKQHLFKTIKTRSLLFCLIFFITIVKGIAQSGELELANEYFQSEEYIKARYLYEKLAKKTDNYQYIYNNYLQTLYHTKDLDQAEKFLKKALKAFPDNLVYRLDSYLLQVKINGVDKSQKELSSLASDIKNNESSVLFCGDYLLRKGHPEQAKEIYLTARKASGQSYAYALPLADVYNLLGFPENLIDELLNYLKENTSALEGVCNTFQNTLDDQPKRELLEKKLYERIQKEPNEITYNELLLWLHIQNKNFNKALMQAKAIDKRNKTSGAKLIEVGKIAYENKDFENAIKYFQYVVDEYKNGFQYSLAKRYLINSKEELVKNMYPVEKEKIISLIKDYENMISELGKNHHTFEAMRSMALLYAFYLDRKDTAKALLEEVIKLGRNDHKFLARAKLDLGDIHLLIGEPWEASLIYSQVEKAEKDDHYGHEAKLKNAKLAYFKGEFELAQAHLDILKMATTREIANDAMELSILIQDNIGLDSTEAAMREYAAIDLLLFQNKTDEALRGLDAMLKKFPNHSLTDDIFMQKAKIYRKIGKYEKAVQALEVINSKHGHDILGDDALFMMAEIYEFNMANKEKAMDLYQDLLLKHPGSIFTAEARKRIRIMRGDRI